MVNKADIILIIVLLLVAVGLLFSFGMSKTGDGAVIIMDDGKTYGRYELDEDIIIEVKGEDAKAKNILQIKKGMAKMIMATCPDGLCLKQGEISHSNEAIICLPNKVVVEIVSSDENEFDAIVK